MIVVDTNVVSEMMRPTAASAVLDWAAGQSAADVHVTAVTVAEVRFGVERLPEGRRKRTVHAAAEEMFTIFAHNVLPFDADAAEEYATIAAARRRAGRPVSMADTQIAAICRATGSVLATGNGKDFADTGVDVVDPWHAG